MTRERTPRSLERRLTWWVLLAVGAILWVCGVAMERTTKRTLQAEFDRALLAKAQTIAALLEQNEEGVDFDFVPRAMPEFARDAPEYFELWLEGWSTSQRSESLGADRLPRDAARREQPRWHDFVLADGARLRILQMDFLLQLDPAEEWDPAPVQRPAATLVVGRTRADLDAVLRGIRAGIAAGFALAAGGVWWAIRATISRGLAPLRELRTQLSRLHARALNTRVHLDHEYEELSPLVAQTNALLADLERAFERERLFAVAAAHELKTPLAEIRSLAEVAARFSEDRKLTKEYLGDIAGSNRWRSPRCCKRSGNANPPGSTFATCA